MFRCHHESFMVRYTIRRSSQVLDHLQCTRAAPVQHSYSRTAMHQCSTSAAFVQQYSRAAVQHQCSISAAVQHIPQRATYTGALAETGCIILVAHKFPDEPQRVMAAVSSSVLVDGGASVVHVPRCAQPVEWAAGLVPFWEALPAASFRANPFRLT